MENSASAVAPLLLRNFLTSIFILADKSLFSLSQKYKLLQLLRSFLVSSFLFFLSLLPAFFSSLNPSLEPHHHSFNSARDDTYSGTGVGTDAAGRGKGGGSGVSRALSQLLLIMNDIPVSSRKYEVVRSLAEKLIDENLLQDNRALREVNCAVLSTAFATSLSQLEAEQRRTGDGVVVGGAEESDSYVCNRVSRLILGVKYFGRRAWCYAKSRSDPSRSGRSAEKLAAELLWLAQKMAASGCAEEAVCKWASASNLALLALSAEPRLQGSLVKVSAFLIKEAKEMGKDNGNGDETDSPFEQQHIRHTKMKLLMSWLPLLCRANNGTDAPILSLGERAELERTLEEIIATLDEEEQEWVLSLWLHHFTYCPASDWPNLRLCYTRWYNASRASLMQSIEETP
ncbi:uncharacterized protein LOC105169231 isoform X2 [Sesamum indicum]|uniref:Uncharacterized protein LOC105169231 isoform X1 n=1 Tax=Sesamum indicum TaxID=4182 RepID=A0A8M8V682_SESIN|nr:uncharacterized protein LOC105169231 isoform X1 [Sesamum indicum]XP_020551581.1 uncharacterized protein LOC105169231 isoform X2 [Sesamum indicum]